jgi:hypothetical protein
MALRTPADGHARSHLNNSSVIDGTRTAISHHSGLRMPTANAGHAPVSPCSPARSRAISCAVRRLHFGELPLELIAAHSRSAFSPYGYGRGNPRVLFLDVRGKMAETNHNAMWLRRGTATHLVPSVAPVLAAEEESVITRRSTPSVVHIRIPRRRRRLLEFAEAPAGHLHPHRIVRAP